VAVEVEEKGGLVIAYKITVKFFPECVVILLVVITRIKEIPGVLYKIFPLCLQPLI
jgi:hypothetical protein